MNKFQREKISVALLAKPFLKPLVKRLTGLGGDCAVVWWDDALTEEGFVFALLAFGRATNGRSARLRLMENNQCHENSRALSVRYPKLYQAETGYALSADGTWRPHSWVWDVQKAQIVETTELRTKYFGITENKHDGR